VIGPFLLAAVLAAAPAPEPVLGPIPVPDRAQLPVAANPARLDERITLKLEDAAVVDVLEKLADLLGVTPILEPGVGGRLSLVVRDLPISKALELVEAGAKVDITVSARLLRVRAKAGSNASGTVPAPATSKPSSRKLGEALRFRLDGAGAPAVTVRVPAYVGRFELPGCTGPVTVGRLGASGGGAVGVALASASPSREPSTARILGEAAIDGTKVLLPGCDGRLVVEVGDSQPGTTMIEPVRVPKEGPLVATMRLLELTDESEETLAAPTIQFQADGGFSTKSGFTADAPGSFAQVTEIHGVPLELRGETEELLLAVYAGVTRTPATANAIPTLVARRAESLWLRKGRPVRWTVDSSWDGGRAALVLELTFLGRQVAKPK
jgi:hypothetical protein